jgi:preprotein translocase subunit Sec61beta
MLSVVLGTIQSEYGEGEQPHDRPGAYAFAGLAMIFRLRKEFPTPSLAVFVFLQLLDILTTLLGLRVGAREGSLFIGRLMKMDPMAALLISKLFAVVLVLAALRWHRPRVVVLVNYWVALVVVWNLIAIYTTVLLH